jgi:hypothetical protein
MMNRRRFLTNVGIGGGGAALGYAAGKRGLDQAIVSARFHGDDVLGQRDAARVWYRHKFIGQPVMDTQLMFWLGLAPTGLTDVGEVLDTATRIRPGDEVSWFEQWLATAGRVRAYGDDAMSRGHTLSAASHYYRAGAYYRAGLMRYADRADPRVVEATRAGLDLHDRALTMRGYDSRQVDIPYEASVLHGRVHYARGVERGPVVVLHQGLHAWPEDTMWVIDGALQRGYHVLSFHGPGQGASLRLHGHPFRPDWEVPVGRVLDFAEQDPRLDPDRFILMGLSFGGYLAPRAASYERRLHALIANPGVVSWGDSMLRHFASMPGLLELHAAGPAAFDRAIDAVSVAMPDARWYFDDVTWKHGVSTPHQVIDELRKYDNARGAANIRCTTLIMEGSAEDATPDESQRLHDTLTCPKHLMRFDASTASQVHCQGGNQVLAQAWLFDWLDEQVAT